MPSDALGWKQYNERWDSRTAEWITPLDWSDYANNQFYTSAYSRIYRYMTLLYYSMINLGLGNLGPVNSYDILFCVCS
jgi:hypothetical protein